MLKLFNKTSLRQEQCEGFPLSFVVWLTLMKDGTALLGCCHKTYFTDTFSFAAAYINLRKKIDRAYEAIRQDDHFDIILCVFGRFATIFACKLNLVLAEHALDVTVSAQKRRAWVPNGLKRCENYFCDDATTLWVYLLVQIDPGLEIAVLKFHGFSGFFMTIWTLNMTIRCSYLNQTKNVGAGGWRVDNLFEAADGWCFSSSAHH